MTERGLTTDRFSSQSASAELIEWFALPKRETIVLEGLYSSAKAFAIASAAKKGIHTVLLNNREDAAYCSSDLYSLMGKERVFFFPSSLNHSAKGDKKDPSFQVQRTAAIQALNLFRQGKFQAESMVLVAYPHSVAELIPDTKKVNSSILSISKGDTLTHEFVKETLIAYGFERTDFVSEPGQFALRGSLIDLFSYADNRPYRIDFFGDTVENIRVFDIDSQRTIEEQETIEIFPNINEGNTSEEVTDIFTFAGENSAVWITDAEYFSGQIETIFNLRRAEDNFISPEDYEKLIAERKRVLFGPLSPVYKVEYSKKIQFHTTPQPSFNKNFELLAREIDQKNEDGFEVSILSENPNQIERLNHIFSSIEGHRVKFTPLSYSLHEGFTDHNSKICLYTDHQIFDRYHRVKTHRSVEKSERLTINDLNSFQIGDYIVHIEHGVGVFGGLVKTNINGKVQEAVKLIYRDGDVIFLSIHGLHRISRYKSKDSTAPKVYKLGTGAWNKLKSQAKSKVKDIAADLIELYAKRRDSRGFAFSPDTYMQHELEASFIYEDTPDQYKTTQAIKEDMEQLYPMDRLVCGDVGFGKTELAIRASFKAVADSKQVAVLVPTTILALQHYKTFSSRLKEFPCRIEYLSRLKSAKQIKEISEDLEKGKIDIIIGTHRLLNKEIKFKDLGLLVIDEEQKFGVAAKERLRQLKADIDTLTLTATPIPRTLQFSLLGARDLSIINTPPPNRLPVQTEIIDFNEELIRDSINFELERGGQVFFVHNRVEDIRSVEDIIRRLCPAAKICVGHGQMEPAALEKVVLDFMMGDYDIMIATTIVENGIDIPNANTIIINQAQNFGLSDLHQLRGRVGRSNKKAFCYLIVPSMLSVTDEARRRLKAIEAFSDLGSGFNIAMQDLDIRGAGNLLGGEQSGFIAEMGFETYQRILSEAVDELRQERGMDAVPGSPFMHKKEEYVSDCTIDTDLEILIPDDYVSITAEKIRLYKELDAVENEKELSAFMDSVKDRFGPVPEQVKELADTVRLRWLAMELGFEKIVLKNGMLIAYFVSNQMSGYYKSAKFAGVMGFLQKQNRRFEMKQQSEKLYIIVKRVESIEKAYKLFLEMKL
ncbi:MAG: transcription-repair coupling factor [Bacteroidetes bacterium HGW-Bacteroidetes-14]|jgi:transcription-repair coupling factor (superfamily II helicase)|nr:MAG: transcription-repair coupling factor [Bacteroidetes bacterium HGW-Bacteroidetes-14]